MSSTHWGRGAQADPDPNQLRPAKSDDVMRVASGRKRSRRLAWFPRLRVFIAFAAGELGSRSGAGNHKRALAGSESRMCLSALSFSRRPNFRPAPYVSLSRPSRKNGSGKH